MSEGDGKQGNITLTIELDPETFRYVIGGRVPNPSVALMLAAVLLEEMKFRFRFGVATEAAAAQRVATVPFLPRGRA